MSIKCFQKSTLFESDDESEKTVPGNIININNHYAEKYNDWRRKEELQKLKDKYGDNLDIMSEIENDSNDDDSENSESEESSENSLSDDPFDEDFFAVYSALKDKDPKIYDKNYKFYDELKETESDKSNSPKKSSSSKLTLQKYHEKLIEEKKGITEEDESMLNDLSKNQSESYFEELYNIRKNIKDILKGTDNSDNSEDDDLFSVKNKTPISPISPISKNVSNKQKTIPKFWINDQELDEKEKFLKQYVLNKGYSNNTIESDNSDFNKYKNVANHFKVSKENVYENENQLVNLSETIQQTIDAPKYHYEEPDATTIKRYPRNISSIRDLATKDDKKTKRAETRAKKKLEKEQELKRLRKLKREEIENKIKTLKSISGNECLDFKDFDLNVIIDDENDFDAEKYDRKMQLLFGDEYYNTSDNKKPVFGYDPEIDDEFNEEMYSESNKKKKSKKEIKKRKDIIADDDIGLYDDLIGGEVVTRFRYRMVEPNGFGLMDEEILYADDKELNRWCSLTKMSQYRSKEQELYDQKVYNQKSKNIALKKKILKSLYGDETEETKNNQFSVCENHDENDDFKRDFAQKELGDDDNNENNDITETSYQVRSSNKKRRKKSKNKSDRQQSGNDETEIKTSFNDVNKKPRKRRRVKSKSNHNNEDMIRGREEIVGVSIQRLKAYGISNRELKKMKNK